MRFNRCYVVLFIIVIINVFTCSLLAQTWEKTNFPAGTEVSVVAINSSGHIFVCSNYSSASEGNIFRSTDNGDSWTRIDGGQVSREIWSISINTNDDIFITGYYGIYRSVDNGNNWVLVHDASEAFIELIALEFHPSGDIFASGGGIYLSSDNGDSWIKTDTLITNDSMGMGGGVCGLAINSTGDIFAGSLLTVYRSLDDGASWQVILDTSDYLLTYPAMSISPSDDIFLYSGLEIFIRSTNNGNNWIDIMQDWLMPYYLELYQMSVVAFNSSGVIFICTGSEVWHSLDNGNNWEALEGMPWVFSEVHCVAINSEDDLFVGMSNDGLYIFKESDFVNGDANGDGSTDVGDAVYIINYVFKGGPPPDPIEAGDANCDGDTNVGDAVYLISYVFKGGPPPVEPCNP